MIEAILRVYDRLLGGLLDRALKSVVKPVHHARHFLFFMHFDVDRIDDLLPINLLFVWQLLF